MGEKVALAEKLHKQKKRHKQNRLQVANTRQTSFSARSVSCRELFSSVPEWCQHLSGQRQSVRLVVGRTLLVVFTFLLVAKAPSLQLYHR